SRQPRAEICVQGVIGDAAAHRADAGPACAKMSREVSFVPQIQFDELPPDARLWIFPAARPLNDEERRRVLAEADAFIAKWMAHGVPLTAAREMRHNQFVFIGVNERAAGVSGCSVDAL